MFGGSCAVGRGQLSREAAQVSRLVGKTAIVTGGAGGIGAATVQALAGRGASVAVVDIDESKAADVNTLTMYVATSHGKQGVRANTVVPGLILTDAVKEHLSEETLASLASATLTPYAGRPEDVADLVVFLASDESRYITGQMICIDGGMSTHVAAKTD